MQDHIFYGKTGSRSIMSLSIEFNEKNEDLKKLGLIMQVIRGVYMVGRLTNIKDQEADWF